MLHHANHLMFTQNTKKETCIKSFVHFVMFVLWSYVCLFAILTKCVYRHWYTCAYGHAQAQNSVKQQLCFTNCFHHVLMMPRSRGSSCYDVHQFCLYGCHRSEMMPQVNCLLASCHRSRTMLKVNSLLVLLSWLSWRKNIAQCKLYWLVGGFTGLLMAVTSQEQCWK